MDAANSTDDETRFWFLYGFREIFFIFFFCVTFFVPFDFSSFFLVLCVQLDCFSFFLSLLLLFCIDRVTFKRCNDETKKTNSKTQNHGAAFNTTFNCFHCVAFTLNFFSFISCLFSLLNETDCIRSNNKKNFAQEFTLFIAIQFVREIYGCTKIYFVIYFDRVIHFIFRFFNILVEF